MNRPDMNRPELQRRTGAPVSSALAQSIDSVSSLLVFVVTINGETFGLPIEHVRTVFRVIDVTPVPLAPPYVVGLINLRGKILTAVSLRQRLGLPTDTVNNAFAVCLKYEDEDFALIVDTVRDVVEVREADRLPASPHIADARAQLTLSIYRQGETLLPVLDIAKTVLAGTAAQAA